MGQTEPTSTTALPARRKLALVLALGAMGAWAALLSENPNFWKAYSWPPSPSHNWLGAPGALVARASWQTFGFTAPLLPALPMTLALALWSGRWAWVGRGLATVLLIATGSLAMAWGNWPLTGPAAGPGGTLGAFLSLRVADVPIRWVDLGTWGLLCLGMVTLIGPSLPIWILESIGSLILLAPARQATVPKIPTRSFSEAEAQPQPAPSPMASEPTAIEPWKMEGDEPQEPTAKVEKPKKETDGIPIHHHASRSAEAAVDTKPKRPPAAVPEFAGYEVPGLDILDDPEPFQVDRHEELLRERAILLEQAFRDYGIHVKVVGINTGPVITQFEISLETGLRLNKVTRLAEDIALNLRVPSVRMVAPIPGKNTVGVEIPNELRATVRLKEVMQVAGRKLDTMKIPLILGKDNEGRALVHDLADMPHLLIAGSTGTGKSVCMNSIILSMLMTRRPDEVRMIMIDPKVVELTDYGKIPHLMHPVVHDMKKAEAILAWAVDKMEERYELFRRARVRNLAGYNELDEATLLERVEPATDEEREKLPRRMPYIVVFIDEMADLMMTMRKEVETHIIRLAQKSRAAGIHLVIATQKPTVDVITGLIKSNLPSRICFKVVNKSDSRVVLDEMGADRLLGKGDMLFLPPGTSVLARAQGAFASDGEIRRIVGAAEQVPPSYIQELVQLPVNRTDGKPGEGGEKKERDAVFDAAVEIVLREGRGSTSLLQRALGIGYGRAARLIDQMAEEGVVGAYNGSSARDVLITLEEWEGRCAAAT